MQTFYFFFGGLLGLSVSGSVKGFVEFGQDTSINLALPRPTQLLNYFLVIMWCR